MRHLVFVAVLILGVLHGIARAQGIITTFAGSDWVFPNGVPAADAPFGQPSSVTVDPSGNPVVADPASCVVARVEKGVVSLIAGTGLKCQSASYTAGLSTGEGGLATSAAIDNPVWAGYDSSGNLYVLTWHQIHKVSGGIITRLAGPRDNCCFNQFSGMGGPALNANFDANGNPVIDLAGNIYFPANHRILKIAGGIISVFAGTGEAGFGGDGGAAASARLNSPAGLTLDGAGNLYIADSFNWRIRKVTPQGVISTAVQFPDKTDSVWVSSRSVMYAVAGCGIYKVEAGTSTADRIAGGECGFGGDNGPAKSARFSNSPIYPLLSLAGDNLGNIYVADRVNHRLRKISADDIVTTVAGNGKFRYSGERTPRLTSPLNHPTALALDASETSLYVGEANYAYRVRKITGDTVTTFAGTGLRSYGQSGVSGLATAADIGLPRGLTFDTAGNLYISDWDTGFIRKVTPGGIISNYTSGIPCASGLVFDRADNLYAAGNECIASVYKIDSAGKVSLYAGAGDHGYSGDNGRAVQAKLNFPTSLALGADNSLYIAESNGHRVRKVTPDGVITTYAGNGTYSYSGDGGPALLAAFGELDSLAFDTAGNLYVSDWAYGVVRKITRGGFVSTIAGGGPRDQLGDGRIATSASLNYPTALAVDRAGNLFIAETNNDRIRVVLAEPPSMKVAPQSISFSAPSRGAAVTQSLAVTGDISGLDFRLTINTGGAWLRAEVATAATPRLLTITADPTDLAPGVYTATITITPAAARLVQPPVTVTFEVDPPLPPQLSVDKLNFAFTSPGGAGPQSDMCKISNTGGGALNFTASQVTINGGEWIKLPATSGQALPGKPTVLTVVADPTGLNPGVYIGSVTVQSDTGISVTIPVTMAISSRPQALLLTQSGLSFTAVAGGGVVPPQLFGVLNPGVGVLKWNATRGLATGDWLKITPASGESDASQAAPRITVKVDTAGLSAGEYYGVVHVDAPGAANTPQVITVFLNVLPANADPGARVYPPELVFAANPATGSPGAQAVDVYNISATPKTFRSGRTSTGFQIYTAPSEETLDPSRPTRVLVQPAGTFPAGVYTGLVTFQFSDGTIRSVKTTVISAAPQAKSAAAERNASDSCAAARLIPTITTLDANSKFRSPAGWPVGLSVDVHDNCGASLLSGTVTVTVSDGTAATLVPLQSLRNGTWQGTWPAAGQTRGGPRDVRLTVEAVNPELGINGSQVIEGSLDDDRLQPQFTQLTMGSAAKIVPFQPLAPGSLITINGANLADGEYDAPSSKYLTQLGPTIVRIAYRPIPLRSVKPGRIEAVVPFGLAPNTPHTVIVQRGDTISDAVLMVVAAAQPNIFADPSTGQAEISPAGPVAVGDVISISCAGLGLTDPEVGDGLPGPSEPRAKIRSPVTVTIGGQNAEVLFAGLVPGQIGKYVVEAVVPQGVALGDAVPLTLTVENLTSPEVNLAVR